MREDSAVRSVALRCRTTRARWTRCLLTRSSLAMFCAASALTLPSRLERASDSLASSILHLEASDTLVKLVADLLSKSQCCD